MCQIEFLAGGDTDLAAHQVDAGHQLRDRVLDLNARVDFDEIEFVVLVDQELASAGIEIIGFLDEADRGVANRTADSTRQVRSRRFLDQFLMPPLQGAVAFPQVNEVAVPIAENLHFDVSGTVDVFFEIDAAVLEGGFGFLLCGSQADAEVDVIACDAHAAPAAAGRRLDQDGIAHRFGPDARRHSRLG